MRRILPALLVVLLQVPAFRTGLYVTDEGWIAHSALRLSQGEILYRDVHSYLPPLTYWLLELPMRWCPSLLWGRLLALLTCAALALSAAYVLEPFGREAVLLGTSGLALLFALGRASYTIPSYTGLSLACGLGAHALWARGRGGFLAGALAFSAVGFKQTAGAAACLALVLAQLLERRLAWARIGLGGATAAALVAIRLLHQGSLAAMAQSLSPGSLRLYASLATVPAPTFGDIETPRLLYTLPIALEIFPALLVTPGLASLGRLVVLTLYYAPLPLVAAAALTTPRSLRRRAWALALLAAASYLTLWPRADITHLLQVLPPAALLLGALLARLPTRATRGISIVALLLALAINLSVARHFRVPLALPHDGGIRVTAEQAEVRDIVLRLRQAEGEPMLAAPWGALYYFLADRKNPTRYELILPGNISEQDKAQILDTCTRNPPPALIWSTVDLRNLFPLTFDAYFPELRAWRDGNYHRVLRTPSGAEELWERNP